MNNMQAYGKQLQLATPRLLQSRDILAINSFMMNSWRNVSFLGNRLTHIDSFHHVDKSSIRRTVHQYHPLHTSL